MRGQEGIIAMRQRRKRPALVFLDTERDYSPMKAWRDWPTVSPAIATVWIEPTDVPHRLDLRFLIGMVVVITGTEPLRVRTMEAAAQEAGAARVIAAEVTVDPECVWEFRTVRVTDSKAEAQHG